MVAKAPNERSKRMNSARLLNDMARDDREARGSVFFGEDPKRLGWVNLLRWDATGNFDSQLVSYNVLIPGF